MTSRPGVALGVGGLALFALLLVLGQPGWAYLALVVGLVALSLVSRLPLHAQIALGALLGVVFGLVPGSGIELARPAGRIFIKLLTMLIAPMILLSITAGVARMGDARQVGALGLRTVALYLVTMAMAVLTGLVAVNLFEPGAGGSLRETELFRSTVGEAVPLAGERDLTGFLFDAVYGALSNPFASLAEGRILPVVVFSILLGLALVQLRPETSRAAVEAVESGYAAIMKIISWFLRLAPVGIFALVGHLVASVGFGVLFESLLGFSAVVIGATLFHGAITLPALVLWLAGVPPRRLFRGLRDALWVAFSTSSSAATLPVTTRCVEENLEVPQSVSSFVLPLGATVNMDGTALYEAIAALFVANVYGLELDLAAQLVIFGMAMLMSIGAPGIPSAGMVTMVVVLEAVGLPVEAVAVLIAIDRFLDTFRTMVNVEGDAVVAICVARA
jgi:Na+/H+-dicarboxylate symporter